MNPISKITQEIMENGYLILDLEPFKFVDEVSKKTFDRKLRIKKIYESEKFNYRTRATIKERLEISHCETDIFEVFNQRHFSMVQDYSPKLDYSLELNNIKRTEISKAQDRIKENQRIFELAEKHKQVLTPRMMDNLDAKWVVDLLDHVYLVNRDFGIDISFDIKKVEVEGNLTKFFFTKHVFTEEKYREIDIVRLK